MKRVTSAPIVLTTLLAVTTQVAFAPLVYAMPFDLGTFCKTAASPPASAQDKPSLDDFLNQYVTSKASVTGEPLRLETALRLISDVLDGVGVGQSFREEVTAELKDVDLIDHTEVKTRARDGVHHLAGSLFEFLAPKVDHSRLRQVRWAQHPFSKDTVKLLPVLFDAIRTAFSKNTVSQKLWLRLEIGERVRLQRQFRERATRVAFYQYKLVEAVGFTSEAVRQFKWPRDNELGHDRTPRARGWFRGGLARAGQSVRYIWDESKNLFDEVSLSWELFSRLATRQSRESLDDFEIESTISDYMNQTYGSVELDAFYQVEPEQRMRPVVWTIFTVVGLGAGMLLSYRAHIPDVGMPAPVPGIVAPATNSAAAEAVAENAAQKEAMRILHDDRSGLRQQAIEAIQQEQNREKAAGQPLDPVDAAILKSLQN